jgi:5-methylcytosine-specific restriction endonuclease McrA
MFTRNSKRWDKSVYPENWQELSTACKEKANWQCALCNVKHGSERMSKAGNMYTVWLAACHIHPNDKANPSPELICLCVSCHGRFDAAYKSALAQAEIEILKLRKARAKIEKKRRELAIA